MDKKLKIIAEIAEKHLNIDTLEERKSDSLDFHDVSVWAVKSALLAAYEAGRKANSAALTEALECLLIYAGDVHPEDLGLDVWRLAKKALRKAKAA